MLNLKPPRSEVKSAFFSAADTASLLVRSPFSALTALSISRAVS